MEKFAYQKEKDETEEFLRKIHKAELKVVKQEWRDSLEHSKRSHYYQLFLKISADGIWLGEACEEFTNRKIEYNL